jgi:hypothetical protein
MLGVVWLPQLSSHSFVDVSTPVLDRQLVIVSPAHILGGGSFPLPQSPIVWHANHELWDAIPIFKAWAMERGVFFFQHIVIARLHALLLDPTEDVFVLFTHCEEAVGIDL